MAIKFITKDEFEENIPRIQMFTREVEWFRSDDFLLFGAVVKDKIDKDWGYIVISPNHSGEPELIKTDVSLESREAASGLAYEALLEFEKKLVFETKFFREEETLKKPNLELITVDELIQDYFKKHPEEIYKLSARKFEELIACIIKDMGYEVELTQATRDGGRDIIARIRTGLGVFLTHIECKKYNPENKIGVKIIREVTGVHHLRSADKSVIITSSYFTKSAIEEAQKAESYLTLHDFNNLKDMLLNYKNS
ncbi:restriction endonuclease [Acinetobacter lactucae]|uniref:restriction endonuclease n=1 Tax=Acinetobacter lactucae TaxID=1785128 RepID=UPI0034D2A21D